MQLLEVSLCHYRTFSLPAPTSKWYKLQFSLSIFLKFLMHLQIFAVSKLYFTLFFFHFSSNSQMKQAAIFPGTNWCGKGTIANEYSKLGSFGGADKCCRQHDLGCPAYIKSGQEDYGLYNYKLWTLNHCTCDER